MSFLVNDEVRLGVALAAGLLIGAEREQRLAERPERGFAGLRTFGLLGFLGGLLAYLDSTALVAAGAAVVGLFSLTTYAVNRLSADPGVTTEIAMVVTYVIGALALHEPAVAAGAAVIVAVLLASRDPMHRLVRDLLTRSELRDGLVFLLFALVVLPISPDLQVGPYGAINPQSLARLVVVLMAIVGAGHVAQRLLGPRFGLALTGFAGGFVSSSATIAAMGFRAKAQEGGWRGAVAGALASNIATVAQYVVVVAAIDPGLVLPISVPLSAAGVVALASALAFARAAAKDGHAEPDTGRAFRLWTALAVAALVSVISIAAAALQERIGSAGIVVISAVAALADAHSTAGSVATMHRSGGIDVETARLAILTALSSNSLTKLVMAWSARHVKYGVCVTAGVLGVLAAAWMAHMLWR